MSSKSSFIIHKDSLNVLDDLDDSQIAELFKAIKCYQSGEDVELSDMVKIAFSPFKNQFVRDNDKYNKTCKARAESGSKGGKQKVANASKCKRKVAKLAESDSKSDSENERKRFSPPSLLQIKEYIREKGYIVNAEQFFSHYESNNWMVGRTKMKKWRAAITSWQTRENKNNNQQQSSAGNWELGSQ